MNLLKKLLKAFNIQLSLFYRDSAFFARFLGITAVLSELFLAYFFYNLASLRYKWVIVGEFLGLAIVYSLLIALSFHMKSIRRKLFYYYSLISIPGNMVFALNCYFESFKLFSDYQI